MVMKSIRLCLVDISQPAIDRGKTTGVQSRSPTLCRLNKKRKAFLVGGRKKVMHLPNGTG